MKISPVLLILSLALITLSGCIEDNSVDSMITNLGSENESIRTAAMDELAEMSDERTVAALVQIAGDENRTIEERKNAVTVLGRIDDDSAAGTLLNISMDEGEEKDLRMASILTLGEIGNETMLEPLRGLSYGDDGLLLYHAAYVLDQLEENYEIYATYGQLPYPLSEEQRLYRNNVYEISRAHRSERDNGTFPTIENATVMIGYNSRSGYIEVSSDVRPETPVMDEIYRIYDAEAQKRGVDQVPVRFVRCATVSFADQGLFFNITDSEYLNQIQTLDSLNNNNLSNNTDYGG